MALLPVGPNSVNMWEKTMREEQLNWSQSKAFLAHCDDDDDDADKLWTVYTTKLARRASFIM